MYLDIVILSGIGVVGMMVAFFVGFFYFMKKFGDKSNSK